mgnify:CR=1 FL=1
MKFFLKDVSRITLRNLIYKQRKVSKKGLRPWSLLGLSAVWYDVGYDIQSVNIAVCFEILIFFGRSMSCDFFLYRSQKPHSNHVFPLYIIFLVSY